MRIFFIYGRGLQRGEENNSQGGTTTSLLGLGEALSRRGHDVHIFARCRNPGQGNGLTYHDRAELAEFADSHPPDSVIVIPPLLPLLMPLRARARVSWLHDSYPTGGCALIFDWTWSEDIGKAGTVVRLYSMAILHPYVDRVVVGSRWHASDVAAEAAIPSDKFSVINLGAPLEHYEGEAPLKPDHRIAYTSRANRGLDVLLRLFPRVREAVPDAELHIFGYEYDDRDHCPHLDGIGEPGIHFHGAVNKSVLARALRSAALMAYPSTFRETFCISIAEAQTAGLPVVSTDFAAVSERVSDGIDGFLIPPPVESHDYEREFVRSVVQLLQDETLRNRMGAEATKKARREYNWDDIAAQWENLLELLVAGREPQKPLVDPALDLFEPSLLTVSARDRTAQIPKPLVEKWLRKHWTAYGYDRNLLPALAQDSS